MPPTTPVGPPPPTNRAGEAREYLESHGLVSRRPPIRSSSMGTALTDPFLYYLTDRLGIRPLFQWSRALSAGSWFHKRAEHFFRAVVGTGLISPEAVAELDGLLVARFRELEDICGHLGMARPRINEILEGERRDYALAEATYLTCIHGIPLPGTGLTVAQTFNVGHVRPISTEALYAIQPQGMRVPCVIQPDQVYLDTRDNTLWLIDWKTCAEQTTLRLQTCSIENQTLHYLYVISSLLEIGHSSLPAGCTLGGIHHVACQKPTIEFSGQDRDYTIETRTLTRGPRRGQQVTDRNYHGEPVFDNYLARCRRWLLGLEEYQENLPDRQLNPCVNISTVFYRAIDPSLWTRYHARLAIAHEYATKEAIPANFPDNPSSVRMLGGKLSPYLPFYTEQIERWPELLARGPFLIAHRDEEIMETSDV